MPNVGIFQLFYKCGPSFVSEDEFDEPPEPLTNSRNKESSWGEWVGTNAQPMFAVQMLSMIISEWIIVPSLEGGRSKSKTRRKTKQWFLSTELSVVGCGDWIPLLLWLRLTACELTSAIRSVALRWESHAFYAEKIVFIENGIFGGM
jgi:hypothetical protein